MHKIITSNFEIDLSAYNISIQEENSWFSDTFFTKYSYPFDLIITGEINKALGDVLSFDSKSGLYYLPCQYVFYNKIENAFLIFEQIVRDVASVSLKYGMDEFPNFDKNLNELDLEVKDVPNIYLHANSTITKTYPLVNYNFPQIHTDKYDPDSAEYNGFQKIINNRIGGAFLNNYVDNNDVMFNRNIIQPMPYLMYVLNKCFEFSGLQLKGDIVKDDLLKKILIFTEKEPDTKKELDPIALTLYANDINLTGWTPLAYYELQKSVTITTPGKYNFIGSFNIGSFSKPSYIIVYKDGQAIYSKGFSVLSNPGETLVDFDFVLPFGACEIKVVTRTSILPSERPVIFDFQVLPIYFINANGEKETNLLNDNKVDLKKFVPNMTIGTFITNVLNMFNYDVDSITADEIVINRIEKSIQQNEIFDLSPYENIEVVRKFNSDISYLLKYEEEGDVDLGGFFIDKKETKYVTKEFKNEVQNEMSIAVYPLQNVLIGDVFTAKSAQSSDDKLCFVMYTGLQNDNNYTIEPTALAIPNLVETYHEKWLRNRVEAVQYSLTFLATIEDVINLNTKKRGFIFNNLHLFKTITKNQLKNELFEVEIETETII